jgi:hypothetical protein
MYFLSELVNDILLVFFEVFFIPMFLKMLEIVVAERLNCFASSLGENPFSLDRNIFFYFFSSEMTKFRPWC